MIRIHLKIMLIISILLSSVGSMYAANKIKIYPKIGSYHISPLFQVKIQGQNLPIYDIGVSSEIPGIKRNAVFDIQNNEAYHDNAAFGSFGTEGTVRIQIIAPTSIKTYQILPSYIKAKPLIKNGILEMSVNPGQKITVELNGDIVHSLHLFVDNIDKEIVDTTNKNVIYLGPGIHNYTSINLKSNQILYLAGGAVLRGVYDSINKNNNSSLIKVAGDNITIKGHGIIDMSGVLRKQAAKKTMVITGENCHISDILMIDPAGWNLNFDGAQNSSVDNVKIMGFRANSDGIDIVDSKNIKITNCFVRTGDDLIVLKTWKNTSICQNILIDSCILWNPVGHALSIGAEIRGDINNVMFQNCEVLHHKSVWWALRIYNSDIGHVQDVTFRNIKVNDSNKFISLWVGNDAWSTQKNAHGSISNISMQNILGFGKDLNIDINGIGKDDINHISMKNIKWNNHSISESDIKTNQLISNVTLTND